MATVTYPESNVALPTGAMIEDPKPAPRKKSGPIAAVVNLFTRDEKPTASESDLQAFEGVERADDLPSGKRLAELHREKLAVEKEITALANRMAETRDLQGDAAALAEAHWRGDNPTTTPDNDLLHAEMVKLEEKRRLVALTIKKGESHHQAERARWSRHMMVTRGLAKQYAERFVAPKTKLFAEANELTKQESAWLDDLSRRGISAESFIQVMPRLGFPEGLDGGPVAHFFKLAREFYGIGIKVGGQ